jgi:hypothetical protein
MQDSVNMQVKTKRPLQEAQDELAREYAVRARCFPRWITEGRVSATDAQDRLDRLASAMEFLNSVEAVA